MKNEEPLRILFLTSQFPVLSETFISRKVDYLTRKGHEVKILCTRFDRHHPEAARYARMVHQMPNTKSLRSILGLPADCLKLLFCNPRLFPAVCSVPRKFIHRLALAANMRKSRWDVIHLHYLKNADITAGLVDLEKLPVIAGVYGYDATVLPFRSGGLELTRRRAASVSGIVYSSEFLRKSLNDLVRVDVPERVVHPEVPLGQITFKNRRSVHDPLRLLSVGRLHWAKGYPVGLAAVRELIRQGVECRYRIVGAGPAQEELEYSIRNMGLEHHVVLVGKKPWEQVAEEMSEADIFFLPSIKEEFGVVLLEAQASGLPVVASDVGGVSEAVNPGKSALLFKDRDPLDAARTIVSLMRDEESYSRMSREGRQFAERFDVNRIGEQLEDFYRRILEWNNETNRSV